MYALKINAYKINKPIREKEILQYVLEKHPDRHEDLQALKKKDPDRYLQRLDAYNKEKRSNEDLKNNYPEMFKRGQDLKKDARAKKKKKAFLY